MNEGERMMATPTFVEKLRRAISGEPREGPTSVDRLRTATGRLHRATADLVRATSGDVSPELILDESGHEPIPGRR